MPNSKPLPSRTMQELSGQVSKNEELHIILEREVQKMQYGTMTVNVMIVNGKADLKSLNIVLNKRIRY